METLEIIFVTTKNGKLNPSIKNQLEKTFAQTLLDFTNPKELLIFLKDFFSEAEFENFIKRLAVFYWLKKGRSRENIKNNLKLSSVAISEIKNSEKKDGIKLAIKKMEAEEFANVWSEKIKKFVK